MANHTLEIEKILSRLLEHCTLESTKERINSLDYSYDTLEVKDLLSEVTSAKELIEVYGNPAFYEIVNPESALKRVELGGILSCGELLEVALLLKNARELTEYLPDENNIVTSLEKHFSLLQIEKRLEDGIYNAIVSEDEVSDKASSQLFEIRRRIRVLNGKTREYLNKFVTKENRALQENLVTIRNDRYVVPVKASHKGEIPGLIHDISSSGQTLFIEPTIVVEANNELKILHEEEKLEVERILKLLSLDVKNFASIIRLNYELLEELDFIFAKAKLSYALNAVEPNLTDDGYTNLINSVHPLLDPKEAVPVSIEIGGTFDTLVITGPNTGGKTVCLKTIGLFTKMASLGLHIPVSEGSEIYISGKVYADIGDDQSINESLSTFSSHIKNIMTILEKAEKNDLILFDELGSGTDPMEGSALAVAIIEHARKLGCRVVATTHYSDIKLYALDTEGVENASFEFDMDLLCPTYKLIIGSIGKSNAFEISERLGLDISIITNAKSMLSSEHNKFENILNELEQNRKDAEELRDNAKEMQEIAKKALHRAEEKERELNQKYDNLLDKAKREAQTIVDEAKRSSRFALNEIENLKKASKEDIKSANINKAREEINRSLSDAERKNLEKMRKAKPVNANELKVGTQVKLLKTGNIATVIELPNKDMKVLCKAGILKITAHISEIEVIGGNDNSQNNNKNNHNHKKPVRELRNSKITRELDIRGFDTLDGIHEVDTFIAGVMISNVEEAYIIHGKGTGALKNAVREHLRRHKHIKSFRPGVYGEGEDGVTVITTK